MDRNLLSRTVLDKLEEVRTYSSKLRNFFGILNQLPKGDVAIFGGAVRDWHLGRTPKDIDIVVDAPKEFIEKLTRNFPHDKSEFDGYHFEVSGIHLDVWRLEDSWCFRDRNIQKSWYGLLGSVPFDVDSILVFKDGHTKDCGFSYAMDKKEIELENIVNKNPKIHIYQRALRFRKKYGFTFGPKLQHALYNYKHSQPNAFKEVWKLASISRASYRSSN